MLSWELDRRLREGFGKRGGFDLLSVLSSDIVGEGQADMSFSLALCRPLILSRREEARVDLGGVVGGVGCRGAGSGCTGEAGWVTLTGDGARLRTGEGGLTTGSDLKRKFEFS